MMGLPLGFAQPLVLLGLLSLPVLWYLLRLIPPRPKRIEFPPTALLFDDGWGAASTWDARLRAADDIIARAEADNRGIALVPLGEAGRDISLQPPAAARVRVKQFKPKPHAVERGDALPAVTR